jgi:4-hydroxy-2-oxoheptanedioate aldolase
MIYRNRVKEALQSSGVALGTFIQTASPESAEVAAASGFDYIILDMEHGSFGIDSLVNLIRAVQVGGSTPVVRLPDDSESGILKALDAGAIGILIPGISNAEQVRKVTKAARYAPLGTRGACPRTRATAHGLHDWKHHVEWSNQNIMVWIIVETLEGFKNLEEILTTPGLDGAGFGHFDLAQAMGLEGQTHHPDVNRKIEEAMRIAQKNKVEIQVHLFESSPKEIEEAAKRWVKFGVRILSCMTDRRVLTTGFKETYSRLASAR